MNLELVIDEADIRAAIHKILVQKYPREMTDSMGNHDFEIKTTYRENETWRRPKYLRFRILKRIPLCQPQ